jgi:hypothetical protein
VDRLLGTDEAPGDDQIAVFDRGEAVRPRLDLGGELPKCIRRGDDGFARDGDDRPNHGLPAGIEQPPRHLDVVGGRRRRGRGLAKSTVKEGGHLSPGHEGVGAEAVVRRGVAALGDSRRGQPVDVSLKDGRVVIVETILIPTIGVAEGPHQERRHLATGHIVVGQNAL